MRERAKAGLTAAAARGQNGWRKPVVTVEKLQRARELLSSRLNVREAADLLEIIYDSSGTKATVITSQLPIEHWHAWVGDATIADAILDHLMQHYHRYTLSGESLGESQGIPRKEKNDPST